MEHSSVEHRSIGGYLRQARERRHMSLEEISRATRIPPKSLRHLENDRFDLLPNAVFTRGFLKAYASVVELNAADLLANYAAHYPVSQTQPGFRFGNAMRNRGVAKVYLAAAVLVVFGFVLFALLDRPNSVQPGLEFTRDLYAPQSTVQPGATAPFGRLSR